MNEFEILIDKEISIFSNHTSLLYNYYDTRYKGSLVDDLYTTYKVLEINPQYAEVNLDGIVC